MITLLVVLVLLLSFVGAPVFVAMLALAFLGSASLEPGTPFLQTITGGLSDIFGALATRDQAVTLSTIPLFTLTGYIMAEAKTAQRLVAFARALVGWIPGGLALVTIVACAIFTTFTGASGVTIVAIGGLLLPALVKEKYGERFSLGLVTATGSIGLLIPPALPLIVYGIVFGLYSQASSMSSTTTGDMQLSAFSVERFLLAGIVPGIVLIALVGVYAVYVAIRDKVPRVAFDAREAARATFVALPELLIPAFVILTLITGALQIPEAAAVTALYVLSVEVVLYRDIKLRDFPKIARESVVLVGAIFIVMVAATALTTYFQDAEVAERLYAWMKQYISAKWSFLLALNILLLVVGCLMDIFSAIFVVVPLIAPAAVQFGVDPYHLGVIFLLNLEIGYLTPPVGLNLFITSFRFEKPVIDVYRASLPFLLVMLVALGLVTYVDVFTPVRAQPVTADAKGTVDPEAALKVVDTDGKEWTLAKCGEAFSDPFLRTDCETAIRQWETCKNPDAAVQKTCRDQVLGDLAKLQNHEPNDEGDAADDDWGDEAPTRPGAPPDAGPTGPKAP